jgi:polyhydroxyalkanoate synthesis regulator protein
MSDRPSISIKRYAKTRLYEPAGARYVTLVQLAEMMLIGQRFTVTEADTGADVTQEILRQLH